MHPSSGPNQWTDLLGDSIEINRVGLLRPNGGDPHYFNHVVLFGNIVKNNQRSYKLKIAIQCGSSGLIEDR